MEDLRATHQKRITKWARLASRTAQVPEIASRDLVMSWGWDLAEANVLKGVHVAKAPNMLGLLEGERIGLGSDTGQENLHKRPMHELSRGMGRIYVIGFD